MIGIIRRRNFSEEHMTCDFFFVRDAEYRAKAIKILFLRLTVQVRVPRTIASINFQFRDCLTSSRN